eukprot:739904_1
MWIVIMGAWQQVLKHFGMRTKRLGIFDVDCDYGSMAAGIETFRNEDKTIDDQTRKETLMKDVKEYAELFTFDRFDHGVLRDATFINYTQLVRNRRMDRTSVPHNIKGIFDVDCDYGTMAA